MDLRDVSSVEKRSVEAFLSKIRIHLDDIEPLPQGSAKHVTEQLKNLKEEQKYGVIDREQLNNLLAKYDPSSDKPTKSDDRLANSFAKLLYSRPGFHQISSTDYLIENLNIKDRDRDSFLGGHSTYQISPDETLESVKAHHHTTYMQIRSKELLDLMDQESLGPADKTIDNDVEVLFNRDPKNGNALAVMGRNHLRKKSFHAAITNLKHALTTNCDFIPRVKSFLAEALFQYGLKLYNKCDVQKAQECFMESLDNDRYHSNAKLHLEMCFKRVQDMYKRPGDRPNEWNKRRR